MLTFVDDRSTSTSVKQDTKQAILEAAAPLIHLQGFHKTGLKEILDAAGVPKGSFYFYFKSKEDFGLALIDHHVDRMTALSDSVLSGSGPALVRLERFFTTLRKRMEERGFERGCPIGNLAQEVSDLSPAMREKLCRTLAGFSRRIESQLIEAREHSEIAPELDPARTAAFITDAWEGALLRAKTDKSGEALERFHSFVFDRLLK